MSFRLTCGALADGVRYKPWDYFVLRHLVNPPADTGESPDGYVGALVNNEFGIWHAMQVREFEVVLIASC